MFNLRLCKAATIRYSLLKFGHTHLCGIDYMYFWPHCWKCNSFGFTAAICGSACHGPHSDSIYSGGSLNQFDSRKLVKLEAGLPNPWRALIGSNQLWRVNDSLYCREWSGLTCIAVNLLFAFTCLHIEAGQNSLHFEDGTVVYISLLKILVIWLNFPLICGPIDNNHDSFMEWLSIGQETSHYQTQCWPRFATIYHQISDICFVQYIEASS